jgi:catechol 2,3-dioxygenase-like lactoylglutathione lyase family enzyme
MLGNADLVAFVPTRDPDKAKLFYEQTLGLKFISQDPFALQFSAHGVTLRIANVSTVKNFIPAPFTILGWHVTSATSAVRELTSKGIEFERFPAMNQDADGIWQSPSGAKVAWFKDPDGNILSVTQI